MKLYAFKFNGYGAYSHFVMASSREDAVQAITEHIEAKCMIADKPEWMKHLADESKQLYIEYVLEPGQVVSNGND